MWCKCKNERMYYTVNHFSIQLDLFFQIKRCCLCHGVISIQEADNEPHRGIINLEV